MRWLPLLAVLAACTPAAAPPPEPAPANVAQPQALAEPPSRAATAVERGAALAELNCSTCHAVGRTGQSPYAPAPPFRTLSKRVNIDGLAEAFAEGIQVHHRGDREMPMWQMTPEQIEDLIAYLKSLQSGA